MHFTLSKQQLHDAATLGREYAQTVAAIVNDADEARRPAMIEYASTELARKIVPVHEMMRRLGATAADVREHNDAVSLSYGDRLAELLHPNHKRR
jgi:hypothetical protein